MRFVYLDAGLVDELGHHANFCRAIAGECRARAIATRVFANVKLTDQLAHELGASPLFRTSPYPRYHGDPIVWWLHDFEFVSEVTFGDLHSIKGLEASDIVYMNWSWPAHLTGLIRWVASQALDRLPTVIVEVGADPGLEAIEMVQGLIHLRPRDLRKDPRAVLYRLAARQTFPAELGSRLHLVTYDRMTSLAFEALFERRITTLPMPFRGDAGRRLRARRRPITVSVLGHQRPEKGYQLVPEIAAILLRERSDIRLLVHNAEPTRMSSSQHELRHLSAQDPRLELDEAVADPPAWAKLIARSDLVLCPYHAPAYRFAHSSVVAEALANAVPVVVPERTPLADLVTRFGAPGATFDAFSARSVSAAVSRALDDFDRLAELAYAASEQWSRACGPSHLVDALLDFATPT